MKQWRIKLVIPTLVCTVVFIFTFAISGDLIAKWVFGIFTFCLWVILPIVILSSTSEQKEKLGDLMVELAGKSEEDFKKYKSTRQEFDERVISVLKVTEWVKDYKATILSEDDKASRLANLREIRDKLD